MPKLRLKRTPAEDAERQWRKERKAARKAAKHGTAASQTKRPAEHDIDSDEYSHSYSPNTSHKRQRTGSGNIPDQLYDSDDADSYGPQPSTSYKPDYEAIRAQLEEERFREKIRGAFEDDARLYGVEERLNTFAHVPDRWREHAGGVAGAMMDNEAKLDPQYMDDEEYAEWVRAGMWKKKHAEEHAEQLRKKAEKAERRARDKTIKAESARLERAMEEERKKRKGEKERRRWNEAREEYDRRWRGLLAEGSEGRRLKFEDIPWPIFEAQVKRGLATLSLDDLTAEAISAFILPRSSSAREKGPTLEEADKKERKERLRETILRFHPDKFEGRLMSRVKEKDTGMVREAVGQVVRALNTLMGEGT